MSEETELILKAYRLLERVTPLKMDCGELCMGRCCKGDDKTGMWLFPGEYELLKDRGDFTFLEGDGNFGLKTLVCKGHCSRDLRPLACRLFPFFPMIDSGGFDLRGDIRGLGICPILREGTAPRGAFQRRVVKIAKMFSKNEKLRDYIKKINGMLDELTDLAERA